MGGQGLPNSAESDRAQGYGLRDYALTLRLLQLFLQLFGAFWGKVWASGAKAPDPVMKVQEP